jgi:hypothetical protein
MARKVTDVVADINTLDLITRGLGSDTLRDITIFLLVLLVAFLVAFSTVGDDRYMATDHSAYATEVDSTLEALEMGVEENRATEAIIMNELIHIKEDTVELKQLIKELGNK